MSLSQYSRCGDGPVCRPDIVSPDADNKVMICIYCCYDIKVVAEILSLRLSSMCSCE